MCVYVCVCVYVLGYDIIYISDSERHLNTNRAYLQTKYTRRAGTPSSNWHGVAAGVGVSEHLDKSLLTSRKQGPRLLAYKQGIAIEHFNTLSILSGVN